MILPAVQAMREASRKASCVNNVRQVAASFQHHESLHGHLPTGGWGWRWTGDPDRGYGAKQPGGWVFNILPFLEQAHLRATGAGVDNLTKPTSLSRAAGIPVQTLVCPSRRATRAWPYVHKVAYVNATRPTEVARTDYAACSGDSVPDVANGKGRGPSSLEGDSPSFVWRDTNLTGVVFRRSMVRLAQLSDGLSHTYLVGEKYLDRSQYFSGTAQNDDQHMFVGFDSDTLRATARDALPVADGGRVRHDYSFGSCHVTAFNMSLADGAVVSVNYAIDVSVYRSFGNRDDGAPQH